MASAGWALATPSGGTVVAGKATITQTGPKTIVINQQSNKVIIEWKNFDIGKGEKVVFTQPGAVAAALNRVLSGSKTSILGSLTANGTIIITNPKGIVFGASARVDVASIIASTIGISNSNFLAGRMIFDQPGDPGAMVSNAGEITVKSGGLAALVAPGVENTGVITAKLGTVALAAGNAATLDFYGDGLVQIAVTAPVKEVPIGPDGKPVTALVHQAGQIFADGGTVVLTAAAAEGVIDRIINVEGIVRARTIENHQGQIAFVGDGPGEVQVAGVVDASGKDEGQVGGTVHVLGKKVTLASTASIDVSGDKGGGTVLVGGELQGKALVRTSGLGYEAPAPASQAGTTVVLSKDIATSGYIPESEITYVDAGAVVTADAISAGDGGKVVTWSNGSTDFGGYVSARGGASGGNGGLVEASGLGGLTYRGTVDTRAPEGDKGLLLLDPVGIKIVDGPPIGGLFPVLGTDPLLTITDGSLNEQLHFSDVLLATSSTSAASVWEASTDYNFGPNDDNITVDVGTSIDTSGTQGHLYFSTTTLNLYSDILGTNFSGGIGADASLDLTDLHDIIANVTLKDPTTVNVYDSRTLATPGTTVGSIQDAIDIVASDGTVNVGAGTFAGGVTVDKNDVTLQGTGFTATTVVEVDTGSSGFTVTADNVTIDGYLFTPKAGATNTTGVLVEDTGDGAIIGVNDDSSAATRDGNGFEGLTYGIVVRGSPEDLRIEENVMGDDTVIGVHGIDVRGVVTDTVAIVNNSINATFDGIQFESDIEGGSVTIGGLNEITGGDDGIEFSGVVHDGPEGRAGRVEITHNTSIAGLDGSEGDGIVFHGVADWFGNGTTVLIDHNASITGGANGIHLAVPQLFTLSPTLNQGWSIDGASVRISNNDLVEGFGENGILVEGVRGPSGFEARETNLAILSNGVGTVDGGIFGHANGIAITRAWENLYVDCCDGAEGFGVSGWAVENAKVLIAGNKTIGGETKNGILIEGVHAVQTASDGSAVDALAQLNIVRNGEIAGHDNGIAITRGIDLVVPGGGIVSDEAWGLIETVLDAPDFSPDLLEAITAAWGLETVGVSAWGIENAQVRIALNEVASGEAQNGILVEGIHSARWDKWCDFILAVGGTSDLSTLGASGATPGARGEARLVIDNNGSTLSTLAADDAGIVGGENGLWIARGVDLTLVSTSQHEEVTTGSFLDIHDSTATNLDLKAWAIQDATVRITDNSLIEGAGADGIRVEGVQRTVDDNGFARDLLIARNGTIAGHDSGIHLGWGVDLVLAASTSVVSHYVDVDGSWVPLGSGEHSSQATTSIGAWAIDSAAAPSASVIIQYNDEIRGETKDGIRVEGVRHDPARALAGRKNLQISSNGIIAGGGDGIAITRGFDLLASRSGAGSNPLGEPENTLLETVFGSATDHDELLATAGPALSGWTYNATSWAVLYGAVKVDNSTRIEGGSGDGVRVEGVKGTGDSETQETLKIVDNGEIVGALNGIAVTRVLYSTEPCADGGEGFNGVSGWAIENATVQIAGNDSIRGDGDAGILIEGIHGVLFGDTVGEAVVTIDDNGSITGPGDGIRLARGFDVMAWDGDVLGALDFVDAVVPSVSLAGPLSAALLDIWGENDLTLHAWSIQNATVTISGNGLIAGESFDGILVEGVRSGPADPWCGCDAGTASLLVSGNGTEGGRIGGGEHGIQLAQGVDLDVLPESAGTSLDLDLWAIRSAVVRIVDNGPIEGEGFDGIFVRGVLDDGTALKHTGSPAPTALEISGNERIAGHTYGIHLAPGLTLSVGSSIGDGLVRSAFAELSTWAIDGAVVEVRGNDEITGAVHDGILVDGVRSGVSPVSSAVASLAAADVLIGQLFITGNGTVAGQENGITLGAGFTVGIDGVGFEIEADAGLTLIGGLLPGDLADALQGLGLPFDTAAFGTATVEAVGVAIDHAQAVIADNGRIAGETFNGISVRGVLGGADDEETSLIGAGSGWAWNLDISGNDVIEGHTNGILLGRGYTFALVSQPGAVPAAYDLAIESWAIDDAAVRIAQNLAIVGESFDGIQVRGVRGAPSPLADGTHDGDLAANEAAPTPPNLLIAENNNILGARDGIQLFTGGAFAAVVPGAAGTPALDGLDAYATGIAGRFIAAPALVGDSVVASIRGGAVTVDSNGSALNGAASYQPEIDHVALGAYQFPGIVTGGNNGLNVFGDISVGSGLFIWRNMFVGSGNNGILLNSIGLTQPDPSLAGGASQPTTVAVLNNFIFKNGQLLARGNPPAGVSGDGILFLGAIGQQASVSVFQNFIARNAGNGVRVASAVGAGAANIALNQNFLPGGVSGDADRNGRFSLLNEASGTIDADVNWWGTADPAVINDVTLPVLFASGPVSVATILTTGFDSNNELPVGVTDFDNFAFQGGVAAVLPIAPPGTQPPPPPIFGPTFDPNDILFTPPFLGSPTDTPGDGLQWWNVINQGYQTNLLNENFPLGGGGDSLELSPAAGGEEEQSASDCGAAFLASLNWRQNDQCVPSGGTSEAP